ncbi:MAG TPA: hypothetical protein VJT49_03730 [Amycolatopsis sp.]|uniref:hypothetical protein n=1 Tax=Amycolatopsis sp. TaxID=37632 RepID=UPI002B45E564|nr:hypothetical protein [Amycolatopsis sp.]HKS44220.1 hypothetical protein [Amycolatopsis sp.]
MLRWNSLAVAALVGIAIVTAVWWAGPGALGVRAPAPSTVAEATVTTPASCSGANPTETVEFQQAGQPRTGTLDACGHDKNDRVEVTVPADFGTGSASVHLADVIQGHSDLRRPVGLALLALSCLGGGTYVFLVQRGRRQPALVA